MFSSVPRKTRASAVAPKRAEVLASELSRHLLRAQEAERKRISRELHDGTGQGLMTLRLYLAMLANDEHRPAAQAKIREALKLLDYTVEDLRDIIGRLSPRILDELGLHAAIRKEVCDLSKTTGMEAQLDLPDDLPHLDKELKIAIYRCLQEALHNIAKHSQAKTFAVHLENHEGSLCLHIEDDGIGLGGSRSSAIPAFGLVGMRERIAALGGQVQIRSRRDHGTRLSVVLPAPDQGRKRLARVIRYPRNPQQKSTVQKPLAMAAKSS